MNEKDVNVQKTLILGTTLVNLIAHIVRGTFLLLFLGNEIQF